jgi:hypothetical protein
LTIKLTWFQGGKKSKNTKKNIKNEAQRKLSKKWYPKMYRCR